MPYTSGDDLARLDQYTAANAIGSVDDLPSTWSETLLAGFQLAMDEERLDSSMRAWRPHLEERAKAIGELGGNVELASLYSRLYADSARLGKIIDTQGPEAARRHTADPLMIDAILQQRALEQHFPERVKSDATLTALIADDLKEKRETNQSTLARGSGFAGFIGQAAALATDPIVLMTLPFGLGAQVGRGAAVNALRGFASEAAIAAAIEVPIQTGVAHFKDEIDSPWTAGQAAFNVLAAATGAGAIRGAASLAIDAVSPLIAKYRRLPSARQTLEGDAAADTLQRLLDLRAESPLASLDDALARGRSIDPAEAQRAAQAHTDALTRARSQMEAGQPVDVAAEVAGFEQLNPVDRAAAAVSPENVTTFAPDDLAVDARRFQFKEGGDTAGVTSSLQGVERFDPALAGQVLAWEDGAGKLFIVDGHQRLGLARRALAAGQDPAEVRLSGFVLRAADDISDLDAMRVGAVRNLTASTGSALDAAKVLRGIGPAGEAMLPPLPPTSSLLRQGRFIARLDDDAFNAVVNDIVPQRQAAIVGELISDSSQQLAALDTLARLKPANELQARSMVEQIRAAGFRTSTTSDLFGERDIAESLLRERAQALDAAVKIARQDKTTFGTLVSRGTAIEDTGANRLDSQANQLKVDESGQAIEIITRLAHQKGPISEALNAAAEKIKDGARPASVAKSVLEAVKRETGRSDTPGKPAAPARPARVETDLLGDDTRAAQALADEARARDAARNAGQDDIETGDPGDMFSQASRQRDIADLPEIPGAGRPVEGSATGVVPDEVYDDVMAQYAALVDEAGELPGVARISVDEAGQQVVEIRSAARVMDELDDTERALLDIDVCTRGVPA